MAEQKESGELEALCRIDADLIRLHRKRRPDVLSRLHEEAADLLAASLAKRFHLTHAWVFALEAGDHQRATELQSRLKTLGAL